MSFIIRPYRRFLVQCRVFYSLDLLNGVGTV
jgi:hypothetical protein